MRTVASAVEVDVSSGDDKAVAVTICGRGRCLEWEALLMTTCGLHVSDGSMKDLACLWTLKFLVTVAFRLRVAGRWWWLSTWLLPARES